MLHVFCDGSITGSHWAKKGNKGSLPHAWSGYVIYQVDPPHRYHIFHHSLDLGEHPEHSANVAEYMAVRSALHWLRKNYPSEAIVVHSDSQLVICQLMGSYRCYKPNLLFLRDSCLALAATFPSVRYRWIPREQNREADLMSKAWQTWGYVPLWEEVLTAMERYT